MKKSNVIFFKYFASLTVKRKSAATEIRLPKSKPKSAKKLKSDQLMTDVGQNTNYLTSTTMILDQQGNAITDIQPTSQVKI